jgi:ATP-dependent Clp protease ATP-binding subunit ClpC
MLKQVADRLEEQEIRLKWDESVTEKLAKDGYDPKFGARPLRRLIQRTVEDTLSEELLTGQVRLGQEIMLTVQDDRVVITGNETALPEKTETVGKEPGKEEEPVG